MEVGSFKLMAYSLKQEGPRSLKGCLITLIIATKKDRIYKNPFALHFRILYLSTHILRPYA